MVHGGGGCSRTWYTGELAARGATWVQGEEGAQVAAV